MSSNGTARSGVPTSEDRLGLARRRDTEALLRDLAADLRDRTAIARELAMPEFPVASDAAMAEYLAMAKQCRIAAAEDRVHAARDRAAALAELTAIAPQLALAETDPLTGARARAAGLIDVAHEIERCRRTAQALVVAYFDVVGLQAINDSAGQSAGDELLKRVVNKIRAYLRVYDVIVRVGDDEFLCAIPGLTETEGRGRFEQVAVELASGPAPNAIRTGIAQLAGADTVTDLIERAHAELVDRRHGMSRFPRQRAVSSPGHAV